VNDERLKLGQLLQRIEMRIGNLVVGEENLIAQLRSRPILANPFSFIEDKEDDLERWLQAIRDRFASTLERESLGLGHLLQQVRSLSPQQTLERGYAVVRDVNGHVLVDASQVAAKTSIRVRLAKGELSATTD
jgi:exodeoxyribonuclease VII large subunit